MAKEKQAQKRIVIPYNELHPALRGQVEHVLAAREERFDPLSKADELIGGSVFGAFGGGAAGLVGSFFTESMWHWLQERQ